MTIALVAVAVSLTRTPEIHAQATATLTILHNFQGLEGTTPVGTLIQATDGNFYGVTSSGGAAATGGYRGTGTVFKMTPAGKLTTLYSFSAGDYHFADADGASPNAVIQASDGNFYGTTAFGGPNSNGVVFKLTPDGTLTTLHSFSALDGPPDSGKNSDGSTPTAALIQGRDGNFYGTTAYGGVNGDGTIFKITPTGALTTLLSFNGVDGAYPEGAILQANDGNFYCTALRSDNGEGTIVQLTPARVLTVLANFGGSPSGSYPYDALIQARDGNFYGTTDSGGTEDGGAVFELTPNDNLTIIASLYGTDSNPNTEVRSSLIEASDNNFYGTTLQGGADTAGTIFQVTPGHALTTVYTFTGGTNGLNPGSGLLQASDGKLYGVVQDSTNRQGAIYRLNVALPSAVQFNVSNYSINEFAGPASIRVNRIGGTGPISVHYQTDDESAMAGVDYIAASGTLTWAAGDQTPKYIPVTIRNRGVTDGSLRTLALALSDPTGATTLGHPFTATLTISDSPAPPTITSANTANGSVGTKFSYQITATNNPTSYGFQGTADGLSINSKTGLISGTPTTAGTFTYTLNAYNNSGKGSATLTLTIKAAAPVITSANSASATTGKMFFYQITASGSPTSYGFQGTANGLSINAKTGVISGAPSVAGTYSYTLNAYNTVGKGSATLTVTVALGPPVITSATTATGKVGTTFSYQIAASGSPTSYGFQGNANGLSINGKTGVISGTPKAAGTFSYTLNAYNSVGKGSETLTVTITN